MPCTQSSLCRILMDMQAWRARLLSGQWFNHLPALLQDSLLAATKVRRLSPGQRLFKCCDLPCGLYAVHEGSARIGAVSEQGKEALLSQGIFNLSYGEIEVVDLEKLRVAAQV